MPNQPSVVDTIKSLEDVLKKLNYKSKEPFKPGAEVLIFDSGTFLSTTFIKYRGKCGGSPDPLCDKCKGAMEFKEKTVPGRDYSVYVSSCNVAAHPGAIRRVFLADDPIVDIIKIHFNF